MTEQVQGFRLSPQQRCRWAATRAGWRATASCRLRIRGKVDLERLRRALERAAATHDALRTRCVRPPGLKVPLQALEEAVRVEWGEGSFEDPTIGGVRAHLTEKGRAEEGEEVRLSLATPILNADLRSLDVLVAAVVQQYSHPELVESADSGEIVQYLDYSEWQHEMLAEGDAQEGHAFWRTFLETHAEAADGLPVSEVAAFPGDPCPAQPLLLADLVPKSALESLSVDEEAFFLACWRLLLHRFGAPTGSLLGWSVDGRRFEELHGAVGPFARVVPLAVAPPPAPRPGRSFRAYLAAVREALESAAGFQESFPEDTFPSAVGFHFDPAPFRGTAGGLEWIVEERRAPTFPGALDLGVEPRGEQYAVRLDWDPERCPAALARRLAEGFRVLVQAAAERPDASVDSLEALGPGERQQLLTDLNDSAVAEPEEAPCAHDLVRAQAQAGPDRVAVTAAEGTLRYGELDAAAERLAAALRSAGVGPEGVVAVCLRRTPALMVAVLAIWKAGGVYLPLEPGYPRERLEYLRRDSGAMLLLTEKGLEEVAGEGAGAVALLESGAEAPLRWLRPGSAASSPEAPRPRAADPENLAYCIYTSGSTGRPKGVMVPHRGLVHYLRWAARTYPLAAGERVTLHSSISFDFTLTGMLVPLLVGAEVHLIPGDSGLEELAATLRGGSWPALLKLTPAHAALLPELVGDASADGWGAVRGLVLGGEALQGGHLEAWRRRAPQCRVFNEYGPTETVVGCAVYDLHLAEVAALEGPVPIGRGIDNTRLYLLNRHGRPVPLGREGELFIGGGGVTRGYLGRPGITAERFVPDPLSEVPGARLYATGDLARWRPDGRLEFLGRLDDQVKLRGFRIELGEIEAVLSRHPDVRTAVVVVHEPIPGQGQLVAHVVMEAHAEFQETELTAHLRAHLPEPMVPSVYLRSERLPLTANGKVDRKALPAPPEATAEETASDRPGSFTEDLLAGLIREVLGIERMGREDDFFTLGGHSLMAMQLLSRVRRQTGAEITVEAFFEEPTLRGLTRRVDAALQVGETVEPPVPRTAEAAGEPLLLSFSQERLWFFDHLEPGGFAYNLPTRLHISGGLVIPLLEEGLLQVLRRHQTLRSRFVEVDGRAELRLAEAPSRLRLPVVDLSALAPPTRDRIADELADREGRRPFDLARGPLLRSRLLRLEPREHKLLLTLHHAVFDAWSMGILTREMAEVYRARREGRPPDLPSLPFQYPDFATWQRRRLRGSLRERQLSYWSDRLAGAPTLLELPADRPRPEVQDYRGSSLRLGLGEVLSVGANRFGRQAGATPFMVLLAAFQLLLARLSGQWDVSVGVPTAGRTLPETEGLIGMFINTLVLRSRIDRQGGFLGLLTRVRRRALEAHSHQDLPFEHLVDALQPERNLSHSPLFQVMFVLQNAPRTALKLPALTLTPEDPPSQAVKLDLTLTLTEWSDGFGGTVEYSTALFDRTTIHRLTAQFRALLAAAVASPEEAVADLPLLDAAQRHQLTVEWNDTAAPPTEVPIHHRFEEQAARTPEAVALVDGDRRWNYAELEERSGALAAALAERGIGPGERVGLSLKRGAELVVAVLGTLRSGAAYVPLDPTLPAEPLRFLREDSALGILLVAATEGTEGTEETDPAVMPVPMERRQGWRSPPTRSEDLAYLIYTSGSTGQPKGTRISHGALSHYVSWAASAYPVADPVAAASGGAPLHSSIAFDLTVTSLYVPLLQGHSIHLVRGEDGLETLEGVRAAGDGFAFVKLTPTHLRALAGGGQDGSEGLDWQRWTGTLIVGGEALLGEDLEPLGRAAPELPVVNEYGPTEATVGCSTHTVAAGAAPTGPVPIGRPIANTRLHVLDPRGNPTPLGAGGELWIGGPGLAQGYHGQPAQTAAAFRPAPPALAPGRAGERLYRTGDLARYRPDGTLEYRGRGDQQVKVRGFRIELGEIEAVLAEHPAMRAAVVAARPGPGGGLRLAAYAVPREAGAALPSPKGLREYLEKRLPSYMVPATYTALESVPRTASGKVDRRALPEPGVSRPRETPFVPPRNRVESELAAIWRAVLQVEEVGVEDNFFDIGGDSILSIQIVARALQMGLRLQPRQIFQHQTIAALALVVDTAPVVAAEQGPVVGEVPLTPIQRWFFEQDPADPEHYNQSLLLEVRGDTDVDALAAALQELLVHHDALRFRFPQADGVRRQEGFAPGDEEVLTRLDLRSLPVEEGCQRVTEVASAAQRSLDLAQGPLFRALWMELADGESPRLFLVAHHLVVDGVSWRILLGDLEEAYRQRVDSETPQLPAKTTSFRAWAEGLETLARSAALAAQESFWAELLSQAPGPLPRDFESGEEENTAATLEEVSVALDGSETRSLVQEVPQAYRTRIDEVLLTALLTAFGRWTGEGRLFLDLEGHGRETVAPGLEEIDLSRTVGWFTALYPVLLEGAPEGDAGVALRAVKETLRRIPEGGLGYGVLRYLRRARWKERRPQVLFNYLGRLDNSLAGTSRLRMAEESMGPSRSPRQRRSHAIEIVARIFDGRLWVRWEYSRALHRRDTIETLAAEFLEALRALIRHCLSPEAGGYTPSDFPKAKLSQEGLDRVLSELELD